MKKKLFIYMKLKFEKSQQKIIYIYILKNIYI